VELGLPGVKVVMVEQVEPSEEREELVAHRALEVKQMPEDS
jgi:hypothetical protein